MTRDVLSKPWRYVAAVTVMILTFVALASRRDTTTAVDQNGRALPTTTFLKATVNCVEDHKTGVELVRCLEPQAKTYIDYRDLYKKTYGLPGEIAGEYFLKMLKALAVEDIKYLRQDELPILDVNEYDALFMRAYNLAREAKTKDWEAWEALAFSVNSEISRASRPFYDAYRPREGR